MAKKWQELMAWPLDWVRQGCVSCVHCGSIGFCAIGPAVLVYPDGVWYAHVQPEDVNEIVESHVKGGVPVERLVRKKLG